MSRSLPLLLLLVIGEASAGSICRGVTQDSPNCVVSLGDAALDTALAAAPSAPAEANCSGGWQMGPPSSKTLEPCVCDPKSFGCPTVDPAFDLSRVQFAGSFLPGMVLQRAPAQAAVFGTAPPSATVSVVATGPDGWSYSAQAMSSALLDSAELHGTWKVLLPPRLAGNGYTITASCPGCPNATKQTLENVSYGDIWFCTGLVFTPIHTPFPASSFRLLVLQQRNCLCDCIEGACLLACVRGCPGRCSQSNMEDPVSQTFSRNESFAAADTGDYSHIKLFQTRWRPRTNETWVLPADGSSTEIGWEAVTRQSLPRFSAVCWYFGAELDKGINVNADTQRLSTDEKVRRALQ
jgi:hypothetical protein